MNIQVRAWFQFRHLGCGLWSDPQTMSRDSCDSFLFRTKEIHECQKSSKQQSRFVFILVGSSTERVYTDGQKRYEKWRYSTRWNSRSSISHAFVVFFASYPFLKRSEILKQFFSLNWAFRNASKIFLGVCRHFCFEQAKVFSDWIFFPWWWVVCKKIFVNDSSSQKYERTFFRVQKNLNWFLAGKWGFLKF